MIPGTAPRVSVIIPAYNQASYLEESIASVLSQTEPNFELVVVDDGSTDETPRVLEGIRDPRMRVIHQPNAGLPAARNTGIRHSSAPLITLLDADDYFFPEKLMLLAGCLDSHPELGMVSGGTLLVDQDSRPIRQVRKYQAGLDLPDLLLGNPFTPSAVIFRREWIDRVGAFDESLRACEDWDLWLRMSAGGCRLAWVEEVVAAYRYHPGQMTREAERMRMALLTVLGKFFSQPGLPDSLLTVKNQAYAAAHVAAAAYAYHAGDFHQGQSDLQAAALLDPTLRAGRYRRLVEQLAGWADDPRSPAPQDFLLGVLANLPPGLPGLRLPLYRAVSDKLIAPLFGQPPQTWQAHRVDLLKAVLYKPGWLFNRGILRMLAVSWLPIGISFYAESSK